MQKWAKEIQQAKYALVSKHNTRVPHPPKKNTSGFSIAI